MIQTAQANSKVDLPPATQDDWKSRMTQRHARFAMALVISILLMWKTVRMLWAYSITSEAYSHIVLIPFIALALVYVERDRIFKVARYSLVPGLALILAGSVVYALAARLVSQDNSNLLISIRTAVVVIVWAGIFLLCYGLDAARRSAFPLLFLLFMVPLPDFILERTIYLLQEGSTLLSYLFFKLSGVPVLRQGFLLSVPGVTIEVARECSGIRSSIALLITCLLSAHLFLRTSWKKLLFAVLVLPLALIKNGIRITTLTLLSIYVDPGFLTGRLHHEGGFVFFLIALGLLGPVLLWLHNSETRRAATQGGMPTAGS